MYARTQTSPAHTVHAAARIGAGSHCSNITRERPVHRRPLGAPPDLQLLAHTRNQAMARTYTAKFTFCHPKCANNTPVEFHIVPGRPEQSYVAFTWIQLWSGETNVPYKETGWTGSLDTGLKHPSTYYNKWQGGTLYNKKGDKCGSYKDVREVTQADTGKRLFKEAMTPMYDEDDGDHDFGDDGFGPDIFEGSCRTPRYIEDRGTRVLRGDIVDAVQLLCHRAKSASGAAAASPATLLMLAA